MVQKFSGGYVVVKFHVTQRADLAFEESCIVKPES